MSKIVSVLIDLSGTLHVENSAIDGAVQALEKLRNLKNVKLNFLTNTTKESDRFLHNRLTKLGFTLHCSEIFTSLSAAKNVIVKNNLKPFLLLEEAAMEDFRDFDSNSNEPNAVVVGLAPSKFDYQTMNKAFNLILNGAHLIGIHKARYLKTEKGLALGPGPFVVALEYATGKKAEVVGKPEKSFFDEALNRCGNFNREYSFMIGDDVRDDIGGAQSAGIKGILVKTGKYRDGDESKINPLPWRTVDSFPQAVDVIESYIAEM